MNMMVCGSLAKPDPSIVRGSGRKPILRLVPAAGILQSNQIAERAITNILTSGENSRLCYSRGFVKRGVVANFQKVLEKQSELGRGRNCQLGYHDPKHEFKNLLGIT